MPSGAKARYLICPGDPKAGSVRAASSETHLTWNFTSGKTGLKRDREKKAAPSASTEAAATAAALCWEPGGRTTVLRGTRAHGCCVSPATFTQAGHDTGFSRGTVQVWWGDITQNILEIGFLGKKKEKLNNNNTILQNYQ